MAIQPWRGISQPEEGSKKAAMLRAIALEALTK